jgi:hypothetical protein
MRRGGDAILFAADCTACLTLAFSGARVLHQSHRALSLKHQRPQQLIFANQPPTVTGACSVQSAPVAEALRSLHRRTPVHANGALIHDPIDFCVSYCIVYLFQAWRFVCHRPQQALLFNNPGLCRALHLSTQRRCGVPFDAAFSSASRAAVAFIGGWPEVLGNRGRKEPENASKSRE